MLWDGPLSRKVMKSLDLNESQRNDIEYILRMLREYFTPTFKSKLPSYEFQGEQSFQELKCKVPTCDLETQENEEIRDKGEIKVLKLEKTEDMC